MISLIPLAVENSNPQINRMLNEALRCTDCGSNALQIVSDTTLIRPRFAVSCSECNYHGLFGKSIPDAIRKWNRPSSFFTHFFNRRQNQ